VYFHGKGDGDFFAVIDGQQRLTSLYIGLKGTYLVSIRKWSFFRENSPLTPILSPERVEGGLVAGHVVVVKGGVQVRSILTVSSRSSRDLTAI
jgi:hypothetical protein